VIKTKDGDEIALVWGGMPNFTKLTDSHPGQFSVDIEDKILSRQSMKGSVHVQDFLTLNAYDSVVQLSQKPIQSQLKATFMRQKRHRSLNTFEDPIDPLKRSRLLFSAYCEVRTSEFA
jgi:hypothetical protein